MTHTPGDRRQGGPRLSRRRLLGAGAAAAAGVALAPRATASPSEDRYIVNVDTTSVSKMGGMDLRYDFRAETGYVVVEGSESDIPGTAGYAPDLEIELDVPVEQGVEVSPAVEQFFGLQWDKQEQEVDLIHEDKGATGDGARIGIIDDGVLGANPDRNADHPDLANVNRELSQNFTRDGNGPGPLNDDHGTHVAGVAAATSETEDSTGVVGVAPDAEVVDLRVFSGRSGSFTDVLAAVVYGTKVGCDVLNLSLGTPPLIPVEKPPDEIGPGDDPDGAGPIIPVAAEQLRPLVRAVDVFGRYAVDNGTLPVAAAGNDAVNLDDTPPGTDETPVVLPAGAEGFISVGATGPIGFGWPADDDSEEIAGFEVEDPIVTVLRTEEPSFYTNYGADAVDVTAGGGNADTDAIGESNYFFDLLFATGIDSLNQDRPDDAVLEEYEPGYSFKAGTSFAAPNVAGLAALLAAIDPEAGPEAIREVIEDTAEAISIGEDGVTTAPGANPNAAFDGEFDGDEPTNPGEENDFDVDTYRGEGHIEMEVAVDEFLARTEDDEDEDDDSED